MASKKKVFQFPKEFLFGTATAGHQIEGNNVASDWWQWEMEGKTAEPSGWACNSWELWKDDVWAIKKLNNNAYRFSLEWARIEPEEGRLDELVIKQYSEQIKFLRQSGIRVALTLWHFVLPRWFAERGGFGKGENLKFWERYVGFVLKELEEYPDLWISLNEPSLFVAEGYFQGVRPPGRKNLLEAIVVYFRLAEAHKTAYRLIRRRDKNAQVGMALSMSYILASRSVFSRVAKHLFDLIINTSFVRLSRDKVDFIGVNYYQPFFVSWENIRRLISGRQNPESGAALMKSDLGWDIWPEGIYHLLLELRKFGLPIYITENGIADERDTKRGWFIREHLRWIWRAIQEGVDVGGYFYWTLMDNFEWLYGFGPKFGLFSVNRKTFRRTSRPSAKFYSEVARNGKLTDE